MQTESHSGPLPPGLAAELLAFATRFSHSLGAAGRFRVELGPDPSRFFASLGRPTYFLCRHDGLICGSLALSLDPKLGSAYLGELKTAPGPQRGRILLSLADAAKTWLGEEGIAACHAFVMAGSASPLDYTGRLGLPRMERLLEAGIDLVPTTPGIPDDGVEEVLLPPDLRAAQRPRLLRCRSASARLLDTWAAKRLYDPSGREIRRLHLGRLVFESPEDAEDLIRHAASQAAARSAEGLFLALRPEERRRLPARLLASWPEPAKYAVYGHGHETWNQSLCSAEV
ncbi:MAG: hypothetical protein RL095_41 [Verrucomicrobiota bacterium]|jgi:hypothetical protein